jgi:hypothetical protein
MSYLSALQAGVISTGGSSALTGTTILGSNVEMPRITNANYITIPALEVGWYLFTCSQVFYAYDPGAVTVIATSTQYLYLTNNIAVSGNFLPSPLSAGVRYSAQMPGTVTSQIINTPISFVFYNDASEVLYLGTQGNCAVVAGGVVRGSLLNTKLVKLI